MKFVRGFLPASATGYALLFAGLLLCSCSLLPANSIAAERQFGAFGPEGARMREQLWILPSGDPSVPMRATVFRPDANPSGHDPKRPLVVINHGTDEATRQAVSMPVYYWMSRWFVERGYVVLLPQRRGHGATGGPLKESIGTCAHPDHYASGNVAASDIASAVQYMTKESFVEPNGVIVVGVSTGGWASLALSARNLPQVQAIVNFSGGRGGHAYGKPGAICGKQELLSAAGRYASRAHEPTIWFYAQNDSYFGPKLAENLARVWSAAGGSVEEHILPPYGYEGHTIADDRRGWDIWGPSLQNFLVRVRRQSRDGLQVAGEPKTRSSAAIQTSTIEATKQ